MCHSRSLNTQINRIDERALRIVYNDNDSTFEELLRISGSVRIHHRNIQQLATEIYKALNNLSSTLMKELFQTKQNMTFVKEIHLFREMLKRFIMTLMVFRIWLPSYGIEFLWTLRTVAL